MNGRALLAEFIGTFTLLFIGIGSIAANGGLVGVAFAHGLAVACMASAVGVISGGHFNPAVSLAAWMAKKISATNLFGYWIAQIAGAVAGSVAIGFVVGGKGSAVGMPELAASTTVTQGAVAELIGTFFLVFVIFGTAIDRRAPKMGALFIGLTITFVALAIGPLTGASINPARYLGPAMATGNYTNMFMYVLAALAGGALAAIVYSAIFGEKDADLPASTLAP